MIITIWGKAGAWKSTVTKLLSEDLGYEVISIGAIKRKLAQERWLTISEFNELWYSNPELQHEFDLQYEEYQQNLDVSAKIIIESRLWFYNQPHAFKVFLDVDARVAAERIHAHAREEDSHESVDHAYEATLQRDAQNREAYIALYEIDMRDMSKYDLVVNTSDMTPQQVSTYIQEAFTSFLLNSWKSTL